MLKKSRLKAALAIVLSAAVFAALVFLIVLAFQNFQESQSLKKLSEKDIKFSAALTVTAQTGCLDTIANSYLSAKTGVNTGAQAISADIAFRNDGTPVLAAGLSEAGEDAVTLERVLDFLKDKKEVSMILNLNQVTNLPEIERLAKEKDLVKRLIYTGINKEQADYLQSESPNIRFYIDCEPEKSKLEDPLYCSELAETALSRGALGINCSCKLVNETLLETVHAYGLLISVWGVEKDADMYRMLDLGVDNIITKKPDRLLEIIKQIQEKASVR